MSHVHSSSSHAGSTAMSKSSMPDIELIEPISSLPEFYDSSTVTRMFEQDG